MTVMSLVLAEIIVKDLKNFEIQKSGIPIPQILWN